MSLPTRVLLARPLYAVLSATSDVSTARRLRGPAPPDCRRHAPTSRPSTTRILPSGCLSRSFPPLAVSHFDPVPNLASPTSPLRCTTFRRHQDARKRNPSRSLPLSAFNVPSRSASPTPSLTCD
ncbi:hypothetical protein B0H14DRAFT_2774278, partial [Mycena olivaceomarginata]